MSGPVHNPYNRGVPDGGTTAAPPFEAVVIAASLGGPAALSLLVAALPETFPTPVLVVQHRTPGADHAICEVLRRRTALPVRLATDGQSLATPGITLLPARHTATVVAGRLRLRAADTVRTADPLMISLAAACGPRTIGVVLTGRLDDGAAGVRAVKQHGGRVLVEDHTTAQATDMPAAARATGCVDLVLPLPHLAHALIALTTAPGAADLLRTPPAPWAVFAA